MNTANVEGVSLSRFSSLLFYFAFDHKLDKASMRIKYVVVLL